MSSETPKSIEVVRLDAFEKDMLGDIRDDIPALKDLQDEADLTVMHAPELVQDLNALFWKDDPQLRRESELDTSAILNRVAVEAIRNNPATDDLRRYTTYDSYATALATVSVSDQVIEVITKHAERLRELEEQKPQPKPKGDGQKNPDGEYGQSSEDGDEEGDEGNEPGGDPGDGEGENDGTNEMPDDVTEDGMSQEEWDQAFDDFVNQATADMGQAVAGAIGDSLNERSEEEATILSYGLDPGEVKRMDYEARRKLMQRLARSRMARWRDQIGRFRFTAKAEQSRKVEHGRDELYTFTLGRDPAEVVPSEFAMLASPSLKPIFMRKFAEGQLLSQKWRGKQKVGDGPIIVLLDSSGSMEGAREGWSKAVCMALMEVAKKDNRAFTTIIFSSAQPPHKQMKRVDGTDLEAMITVGELFYDGGTNFDYPVMEAINILTHEKEHQKSDIVIITDGECNMAPETWARIEEEKAKGLRIFGIDLGGGRTPVLERMCDNVRFISDLKDPNTVADLYQVI